MQIRVHSDLHLEFQDWIPPSVAADVVVLAGDIHVGAEGLLWARQHFADSHLIYVPGNHEYYGGEMESTLQYLRGVAAEEGIALLDCDSVVIEGVRFLGATLWTDFALYGSDPEAIERAQAEARRCMADYRRISLRDSGRLQPEDTRRIHQRQSAWLTQQLAQPFAGATVVVTHHLPHMRSVHPRFEGELLNASFASNLSTLVRDPVQLWIHGHTHESMDYQIDGTRVVCNPRGYLPQEPNDSFDPEQVVCVPQGG
ncbi:MAG TPA: metallophosphoesterase [Steroidobacteraceae bacterium]|nr:metallophosphoesterase [Steroidobacteraceae bacterium]